MGRRSTADWDAVRAEWEAGQLSVKELARQFGVTPGAIHKRAERHAWPPRPEGFVTPFVTPQADCHPPVTNPQAVALQSFERVIQLMLRHRGRLKWLNDELEQLMVEAEAGRSGAKPYTQAELESRASFLARVAGLMDRLNEMERAAFGLTPTDLPSEADTFSSEQLELIQSMVRSVLGRGGG